MFPGLRLFALTTRCQSSYTTQTHSSFTFQFLHPTKAFYFKRVLREQKCFCGNPSQKSRHMNSTSNRICYAYFIIHSTLNSLIFVFCFSCFLKYSVLLFRFQLSLVVSVFFQVFSMLIVTAPSFFALPLLLLFMSSVAFKRLLFAF